VELTPAQIYSPFPMCGVWV